MSNITDADRIDFLKSICLEDGLTMECNTEDLQGEVPVIELFTIETQWIEGDDIRNVIDVAIKKYKDKEK